MIYNRRLLKELENHVFHGRKVMARLADLDEAALQYPLNVGGDLSAHARSAAVQGPHQRGEAWRSSTLASGPLERLVRRQSLSFHKSKSFDLHASLVHDFAPNRDFLLDRR